MSEFPGYSSPNAPQTPPGGSQPVGGDAHVPPVPAQMPLGSGPMPPEQGQMPPGYPQQLPPPQKQRNTVGIIALVTAIVGFLFAVIPGALMVGWILLPIAFILAIVGLVQSGKSKGTSITALILSIVGAIVGVVVFFAFLGGVIDDVLSDEPEVILPQDQQTQSVDPAPQGSDNSEEAEKPTQEATQAAPKGTRSDPVPLGSTIRGKDWDVTVVSFTADATDEVVSANMFNDAPAEGKAYALIEVEVTYTGDDSGTPWLDISLAFVTESGNTIRSSDSFVSAPAPSFLDIGELYEGASGTGYIVLEIPVDESGTLRVSPGFFADDVFVAIS